MEMNTFDLGKPLIERVAKDVDTAGMSGRAIEGAVAGEKTQGAEVIAKLAQEILNLEEELQKLEADISHLEEGIQNTTQTKVLLGWKRRRDQINMVLPIKKKSLIHLQSEANRLGLAA